MDGGFELTEEGGGDSDVVTGGHHTHAVDGEVADDDDGEDPYGNEIDIDEEKKGEVRSMITMT